MEYLVTLLVDGVLSCDRLAQKPLNKLVPDLDLLLATPRSYLRRNSLIFGPMKRYGTALFFGALIGLLLCCNGFTLLFEFEKEIKPVRENRGALLILLCLIVIGLPLFCTWMLFRLLLGGQVKLDCEGVTFEHRRDCVKCPWALFAVAGQPFSQRRDRVSMSVAEGAEAFVEHFRDGVVVGRGCEIRTKSLRFVSASQIVLKDLYEVQIQELASLLEQIGGSQSLV